MSFDWQCFVALPSGTLRLSAIVVFPDHTYLLFANDGYQRHIQ